jgi:hypothetical protein
MRINISDGGRAAAGFTGRARDCVCRAIAIATGRPYPEIHARLAEGNATQRITKRSSKKWAGKRTADHGIQTSRKWFREYMGELGFAWMPTMRIGQGCKVHLRDGELPGGKLVVQVSRHFCAVINRVLHDTHDCTRGGMRCVYGYWKLKR